MAKARTYSEEKPQEAHMKEEKSETFQSPPPVEEKPQEVQAVVVTSEDRLKYKYRVKVRTTISLFGQMVVLPMDSVIAIESYGPEGMRRILESNVPLEKLE